MKHVKRLFPVVCGMTRCAKNTPVLNNDWLSVSVSGETEPTKRKETPVAVKKISSKDIVMLKLNQIEPNPDNPNRMSDAQFQELLKEIERDGFDEPILVIPHPDSEKRKNGMYMLAQGEHRWAGLQVLGESEIPAIIKDWDEKTARIKSVRRNVLHGDLDKVRFGELVKKLNQDGVDSIDMPDVLGFTRQTDFDKLLESVSSSEKQQTEQAQQATAAANPAAQAVDNVTYLVNEIFSEYGDTVNQSFMFFWYKNNFHLMVLADDDLRRETEHLSNYIKASHTDMAEFFTRAIKAELDRVKDETGVDPRDAKAQFKKPGNDPLDELEDVF